MMDVSAYVGANVCPSHRTGCFYYVIPGVMSFVHVEALTVHMYTMLHITSGCTLHHSFDVPVFDVGLMLSAHC